MVRTVQAPTQIRSPSWSGTRTPPGISPPLTIVPLAEPGSSTAQLPSGSAIRTACRCETPGSVGRPGQVDLRLEPAGHAAPADAHFLPGQPEPALGAVPGELDRGGVRAARRDHAVEVGAVRGHHRRPRRGPRAGRRHRGGPRAHVAGAVRRRRAPRPGPLRERPPRRGQAIPGWYRPPPQPGRSRGIAASEPVGLPEAKSYPQVSQNCPDRAVPHWGQGSAAASDPAGAEAVPGAGAETPDPGCRLGRRRCWRRRCASRRRHRSPSRCCRGRLDRSACPPRLLPGPDRLG